jgi:hypothetical protein
MPTFDRRVAERRPARTFRYRRRQSQQAPLAVVGACAGERDLVDECVIEFNDGEQMIVLWSNARLGSAALVAKGTTL